MIFAIIPARSGSKGVPDKNIRQLGGFSLIEWSIAACKKSRLIDEIYVSTDSREYQKHAIEKGAKVPFLRPKEISNDLSTDYEFIMHALNWFKENHKEPEIIALIRPTTPLRDPIFLDNAFKALSDCPKRTSLRSVHEMSESAYKTFEISNDKKLSCVFSKSVDIDPSNNARQSFPKTYIGNGYIDLLKTKFIRKNNSLYGTNVLPFITPTTYEIDNEEDFNLIEYQLNSKSSSFLEKLFN